MPTDTEIRIRVIDALAWAPDVYASEIGVTVHNGVATIFGHLPSFWQKNAAVRVVRAVRGVRGLVEDLKVSLSADDQLSDEQIAERASFCLASDVSMSNEVIRVTLQKGVMTLTGQLCWHYLREQAAFAVSKIAGVTDVVNDIELKPRKLPYDVVAAVTAAFTRSGLSKLDRITLKVRASHIRLGGFVHNPHERAVAETATWSVPGVTKVENTLAIY